MVGLDLTAYLDSGGSGEAAVDSLELVADSLEQAAAVVLAEAAVVPVSVAGEFEAVVRCEQAVLEQIAAAAAVAQEDEDVVGYEAGESSSFDLADSAAVKLDTAEPSVLEEN